MRGRKSTPTSRVRRAELRDIAQAVALFSELDAFERRWRIFALRGNPAVTAAKRYRRLIRSGKGCVALAELDSTVVGISVGEVIRPSSSSDQEALEISHVYVQPEHCNRGLGSALVAEIVDFALEKRVQWVTLKVFAANHRAIDYWTHLGLRPQLIQFTSRVESVEAELVALRMRVVRE